MPTVPACKSMGRHCREVDVTLRVGDRRTDSAPWLDGTGTWLLGHTERISFGPIYRRGTALLVDATVHVPCKYLRTHQRHLRCTAHGYRTREVLGRRPPPRKRKRPDGTFELVSDGRLRALPLSTPRTLRVLSNGDNPCATARCRTSDGRIGAACCRDLVLDIELPKRARLKEAQLAARKAPYFCKVERTDESSVEAEVISACSYLGPDGRSCGLHGRRRPNGRVAKPWICTRWPQGAELFHRGCVLATNGAEEPTAVGAKASGR